MPWVIGCTTSSTGGTLGDYDVVSTDVVSELGRTIVDAAGLTPGTRVPDVAAGSGNASLPAAAAGARVVASDLTPELLETGRQRAVNEGLDIKWMEADAEHLPFDDGDFDTVLSCVGVMFAPFHQLVADELVRVTRRGGRIALVNWTPTGFIGQIFAVMKSYVPPPPAGAQPGPLWGTEDHVRTLLGDRVTDLQARPHLLTVEQFENAESFRDFWTSSRSTTARLSLLIATSRMTRTAASGSIRTSPISPDVTVLTTAS